MLAPTTQEEIDRRDNLSSKVGLTADIMNMLTDIEDPATKLKILKSLLSTVITDASVIALIQDEIDKIESEQEETSPSDESVVDDEMGEDEDYGSGGGYSVSGIADDLGLTSDEEPMDEVDSIEPDIETSESDLPTPEDLGVGDLTDNNNSNM